MNITLIYPMLAMVALTFSVAIFLFLTRVNGVRQGKIHIKYFRTYNEGETTALEQKANQHFANLFEVPVLFYAASITAMVLPVQGNGIVIAAWIFVATRVAHAYTHIGPNRLYPRMVSFFTGFFSVIAMWILIGLEAASRS
jgi:hypothetical protein